jgi:hypothetical protein
MDKNSLKLWNSTSHEVVVDKNTLLKPRAGSIFWSILPGKRKYCIAKIHYFKSFLEKIKCIFTESVYIPHFYVKEIDERSLRLTFKKKGYMAANLTKYRLRVKNPAKIWVPAMATLLASIIALACTIIFGPYTVPVSLVSVTVLYLTVGSLAV